MRPTGSNVLKMKVNRVFGQYNLYLYFGKAPGKLSAAQHLVYEFGNVGIGYDLDQLVKLRLALCFLCFFSRREVGGRVVP